MSGRLVLVVDDDDMIRRLVRTVLEADDWVVIEADGSEDAFRLVETDRPAIVVLDVMMPGLDGVEVCRKLDHEAVKVVMLTARDDPDLEQACYDAGADRYLTKPFSSITLLDIIEELAA